MQNRLRFWRPLLSDQPKGPQLTDIFLSYNREDHARAKLFADAFAAQGLDIWWDVGLRTGEAYDQVTERALREAKAVVVLWSKRSVESRWVRAEATLADRNKTLVPVMIEPCERPIMFELTQTAELSHWHGAADDPVWLGFIRDVKRFMERGQPAAVPSAPITMAQIIAEPAKPVETLLAVLPFENLSSDAEMQFFSDGVSEDILGRIIRGSKLKAISRTSSFQFRGADKAKAAAALNATHIVDGSIRRASGKVRIAAHLTEAASQTTLWSDKYDRSLDDIFAVQDEISEAIAQALDMAFFPAKTAAIDPAVYELYLRIRATFDDRTRLADNIATLELVTRMAPKFFKAWAALATLRPLTAMLMPYAERRPIWAQAEAALARCRALDPDNAVVATGGWSLCNPFGAYLAQEGFARRMREIGHAHAQFILAYHLEGVGRTREAVDAARRSWELDPKNMTTGTIYTQILWRAGRYAEGIAAMERHLLIWPNDHHTAGVLVLARAHQQDWVEVDKLLNPHRLEHYPLREHAPIAGLVTSLRSPDPASRRLVLERMREQVAQTGHLDPFAMVFPAIAGFANEAFDILDAAKFGPAGGPGDMLGFNAYRSHRCFAAAYPELRANPRFVKMCARLGLVEYWLETQAWPDCADTVPYDFRAECEKYRDHPKDVFFA